MPSNSAETKHIFMINCKKTARHCGPISLFNSINRINPFNFRLLTVSLVLAALASHAAVPAPEKLLPDDTLLVLTVPDFAKLRTAYKASPHSQFFNDPAMKPFKEKFVSKLQEEFLKPLERDLEVRFEDYTNLAQGQV